MDIINKIKDGSQIALKQLKYDLDEAFRTKNDLYENLCIYACGSLGRLELTSNSDLDLFFILINNDKITVTNLDKYNFFSKLHIITKEKYKDPSKGGYYWNFITDKMLMDIGSREEDYNNAFTARMLLILESKSLYNEKAYNKILSNILDIYFLDYEEHNSDFYPLFLMNDIKKYWYTLTINYEYRRDSKDSENEKNWKRLKLKFARQLTCYSMLACLYKKDLTKEDVKSFINKTPLERLEYVHTIIPETEISEIIKEYSWYLHLREESSDWWNDEKNKATAFKHAERFHNLLIHDFMKKVENYNPTLKIKTDIF